MSNWLLQIILNSFSNNASIILLQSYRWPADTLVFPPSGSSRFLRPSTEAIPSSTKPWPTWPWGSPGPARLHGPHRHQPHAGCWLATELGWAAMTLPASPSSHKLRAMLSDHSGIYKTNMIALVRGKQKTNSLWVGRLSRRWTGSGLSAAGAGAHHSCKVR